MHSIRREEGSRPGAAPAARKAVPTPYEAEAERAEAARHPPAAEPVAAERQPVELEHVIGLNTGASGAVAFHPTKKHSVVYSVGTLVATRDLRDPHRQRFFRGHSGLVTAVGVSPAGAYAASGQRSAPESTARVVLWDLHAGRKVQSFSGLRGEVRGVAFSPDGRMLAACGATGWCVWDLADGGARIFRQRSAEPVTVVAWAPAGAARAGAAEGEQAAASRHPAYVLATATGEHVDVHTVAYDRHAMQYAARSERAALPSRGLRRAYVTAAFSAGDGADLYCGTNAGDVVVFSARGAAGWTSPSYRATVPVGGNDVRGLAAVEGGFLAGGPGGRLVRAAGRGAHWEEPAAGAAPPLPGLVASVATSASGRRAVVSTAAGALLQVDVPTLEARVVSVCHTRPVTAVAFGEGAARFFTASEGAGVAAWDLVDYERVAEAGSRSAALCLAAAPGSGDAVTGWADGAVRAHGAASLAPLWEIPNAHRGGVTALAVTSRLVISGGADGSVRLWSLRTRQLIDSYTAHQGAVRAVAVDAIDESLLHTCGDDRALVTYSVRRSARVRTHRGQRGAFTAFSQLRDGELEVVTASVRGVLSKWDSDLDAPTAEVEDPTRAAQTAVAVSPNGRFLAVASEDHSVRVLDADTFDLVATCLGHSGPVRDVRWSPDQKQFVSVGDDGAVCVWNFYA